MKIRVHITVDHSTIFQETRDTENCVNGSSVKLVGQSLCEDITKSINQHLKDEILRKHEEEIVNLNDEINRLKSLRNPKIIQSKTDDAE